MEAIVNRRCRSCPSAGQVVGRSDSTGLAGGDHLHFTLLVGGRMVNPVEWWDPHWMADRVDRKLREAK
jgi:septal ring factor EnvC (AmiA/AmiB activator)